MQPKVCPHCGQYFVMNRQELLGFFIEKKKELILFYVGIVKKTSVTTVTSFIIHEISQKKTLFLKKKLNRRKKHGHVNPFYGKFLIILIKIKTIQIKTLINLEFIYIKQFYHFFLVKRYDFKNDKSIEIFNEYFFYFRLILI